MNLYFFINLISYHSWKKFTFAEFFFAALVGGMVGLLSTLTKSFMFFLAELTPFQGSK